MTAVLQSLSAMGSQQKDLNFRRGLSWMSDWGAWGSGYVWGQGINLQTESFMHSGLYRTGFATVIYGPVALSRQLCYLAQTFPMGHKCSTILLYIAAFRHSDFVTTVGHSWYRLLLVCHSGLPLFGPLLLSPSLYISILPAIIDCMGLIILRCLLCRRLGLYLWGSVVSLLVNSTWSLTIPNHHRRRREHEIELTKRQWHECQ